MSRSLKTVPDDNSNSFLVGMTSNNTAEVMKVCYDEENKKLSTHELVIFPSTKEEMINDVSNIYPCDQRNFLALCYNMTKSRYELKMCAMNQREEYDTEDLPSCNSEFTFEYVHFLLTLISLFYI